MLGLMAKHIHAKCTAQSAAQNGKQEQPCFRDAAFIGFCTALIAAHGEKQRKVNKQKPDEYILHFFTFLLLGLPDFLGFAFAQPFLLWGFWALGGSTGAAFFALGFALPFFLGE